MNNTDVIIIGSGPGGYQTACHAAKNGLQTVIVEAGEVGGTCLNRGCIPTKTLCRNAEVMDTLRHAETFGLNVTSPVGIDYEKVVDRKDEVVRQLRSGIDTLLKQPGIQFLHGTAHFKNFGIKVSHILFTVLFVVLDHFRNHFFNRTVDNIVGDRIDRGIFIIIDRDDNARYPAYRRCVGFVRRYRRRYRVSDVP